VNTNTELTLSDEYTERVNLLIESGASERAIADLCADYERELRAVDGRHVVAGPSTHKSGRMRRQVSRLLGHADR
jgi:hypothetical protein